MKKKFFAALLAVLLVMTLSVTVFASNNTAFVYDDADLLTSAQVADLSEKLASISGTYNAQIIVATVPYVEGGDVDAFVNLVYDQMGFGYGANHDGVLLLVCMDPREYRILSNGFAGDAITMSSIDAIGSAIQSDLSDGNYADAFDIFADKCVYYIDGHLNGYPFNFGMNLMIALIVGLASGLLVAFILKGQLKSVHRQSRAHNYLKDGSLNIRYSNDIFLYNQVTRRAREKSSSSGSSSRSSGGSRNVGGGSF